ncbi:MAG: putative bifunctional diguanylate cyclase/phosphodiesterase [Acidimicrobiales bacterium]
MPVDVARLRNLFHLGIFSLLLPMMALIDVDRRSAWLGMAGISLVGTVASIGFLLKAAGRLQKLAEVASVDAVTGLDNTDALVHAIDAPETGDAALALFDIDNFAMLNSTIGHSQGDAVLRLVADRMRRGSRDSDVCARVGGDRFALLLTSVTDDFTASEVATRLLSEFFEPATIGGLELDISASVGIAMISGDLDGATALKRAVMAVEAAKRSATQLQVFRPEHERETEQSLAMIAQVRLGLDRNEFEAHLQPVVDNWNGRTIGVEALVRWNHPERGVIPPALFLNQIENLPVGRDFSNYMLRHSLGALASLGNRDVSLSVNLSARDVEDLNLPLTVRAMLEEFGVSPRRLTLEVPESVGFRRRDRTEQVLTQLRDLGCGVAIDDFGKTSVPMDFLASLPVTELKIAPEFTRTCMDDSTSRTVIRHIVGLAHGGGLRATAKGVERQGVMDALIDLGCDASQGYHIARPMPASEVKAWLENDRVFI